MKIAFITPSLKLGGYEKVVISYANELVRRDHDIFMICGFVEGDLLNQINDNVIIVNFNSKLRGFIFPLIKFLRENKDLDILYSGFRLYNCISIFAKYISRSKVKIYATQHGFERQNKVIEFFLGKIINKADYKIAVAKEIAIHEKKTLKLTTDLKLLYNPVIKNNEIIKSETMKFFEEKKPIIAMAGRIAEAKDNQLGIKIFYELQKKIDSRLIILGTGPEIGNCQELVNKLSIQDKVVFLGFVNNPMGYLIHCNVFLHPAKVEGFGNVIVEALYCNCPVVTTNTSGPIEIIEENKYGINIGNYNDENVIDNGVKALEQILKGEIKFDNLKERANDFNTEKTTDRFLEVYYENN